MTVAIVIVFLLGYCFITLEHNLKVNKTAIALLLSVACWVLYMASCGQYVPLMHGAEFTHWLGEGGSAADGVKKFVLEKIFVGHVGDTSEIIFFLLGAMTIVEVVDANGGFKFVREKVATKSQKALLWRISFMTFFLSAVLDNLTTSIVMIMVLRKLIAHRRARMRYAGMVIIAANAGGAFSPIGDVTTIMLWIKGCVTTMGVIKELFLPSLIAMLVPLLIMSYNLKGELVQVTGADEKKPASYDFSRPQRNAVFYVGVCGLVFVPVFRALTGLPPFMGILLVLGLLWVLTEFFYGRRRVESHRTNRVSELLTRIDLSTILFFLGILLAVAALQETGVLHEFGEFLGRVSNNNAYLITGVIGVASSIVDNVPLVASCMGMYEMGVTENLMVDGTFWQLLAYCAGTGGSILIIGSAAGVIVMGLERITFGWYFSKFSLIAFVGMVAGMVCYWLEKLFIF